MTSSVISTLHNYYTDTQQHQNHSSPYCTLQWRREQLLVKPFGQLKQPYLASLDSEQSLVECLKHSPVNIVRIDPKLGEAKLKIWANACEQASKPIYLRIPTDEKQPKSKALIFGWLKRLTDCAFAFICLLATSPLMLGLLLLMRFYSPGPVLEREWHVGERGRLFRVLKFRTTTVNEKTQIDELIDYQSSLCDRKDKQNSTSLGRFMLKYGLHNLPLLLNVLRGEMGLVGPRCYTLAEAVRLNSEAQRQLNKLPGITGSWQVEAESKLLHLDSQIS